MSNPAPIQHVASVLITLAMTNTCVILTLSHNYEGKPDESLSWDIVLDELSSKHSAFWQDCAVVNVTADLCPGLLVSTN